MREVSPPRRGGAASACGRSSRSCSSSTWRTSSDHRRRRRLLSPGPRMRSGFWWSGPGSSIGGGERMGKRNPRVDAYIAKSADFARPILTELRDRVHAACPEVEEEMKWSFPHFMYKGMLCSMAAFKQHAAFGFWKGALVVGNAGKREAMGHLGRITAVSD